MLAYYLFIRSIGACLVTLWRSRQAGSETVVITDYPNQQITEYTNKPQSNSPPRRLSGTKGNQKSGFTDGILASSFKARSVVTRYTVQTAQTLLEGARVGQNGRYQRLIERNVITSRRLSRQAGSETVGITEWDAVTSGRLSRKAGSEPLGITSSTRPCFWRNFR